ncbi:MAG: hypothetical protein KAI17_24060 [Thiotrichaceae bacterium]|nr:hypothetical protein [Thiotrichaceae bacterium]
MKKTQKHTPEEVKRFNKSFIEFMKPLNEKTGDEEGNFRMPIKPLLTLAGLKKSAPDNELEASTIVDKPEVKLCTE